MSSGHALDAIRHLDKFMQKVMPIPFSGCWVWTGAMDGMDRYGMTNSGIRCKPIGAHRASWILHFGDIPAGMLVCHRCDVTQCVNPAHLFLGTAKQNTQDMMSKGRHRFATWNAPKGNNHWKRKDRNERFV